MFQMEPVQDLLSHRSDVFNFLPTMIKLGLGANSLHEDVEFAISVCANSPSFKVEGKLPAATTVGDIFYEKPAKFALPFDSFSFITEGSAEESFYQKRITVISREDFLDTDTVLIVSFVRAGGEKPQWVPLIPNRYGVVVVDGVVNLRKYILLKPNMTEEKFKQTCDSTYEEGFYEHHGSDMLFYFTTILNLVNSKTSVSYRPSRQKPVTVQAAAKAKGDFWEYHVVELGTKNSPVPWQGGHHASPRQHERIGHWRHYKSGKKVFIDSMTVGKIENGRIEKDYEVTK